MFADVDLIGSAFSDFVSSWSELINAFFGLAVLLGLLAFGYAITLLIFRADSPQGREDAISRVMKSGITVALTGSFWTILLLLYYMFF